MAASTSLVCHVPSRLDVLLLRFETVAGVRNQSFPSTVELLSSLVYLQREARVLVGLAITSTRRRLNIMIRMQVYLIQIFDGSQLILKPPYIYAVSPSR